MADLRDREVAVSEKNDSRMGPSGRRARSADSCYLEVGGSKEVYDVTVNFVGANGHWCQTLAGVRCHGNGNGKSRTYGKPPQRDKHNPQHWCKHVQAALADVEKLAEAQDRTAAAFGQVREIRVPEPKPEPVKAEPVFDAESRLAELDAERDALAAQIDARRGETLAAEIKVLCDEYGTIAVGEALDIYANGRKVA